MLIPKFTNLLQSTSRNICFYQNHFLKINTAFLPFLYPCIYTPCHFETHDSSFIFLMLHEILSDKAIIKASCIKISVSHTLNTVYETCIYPSSKLFHYGNRITLRVFLTSRSTSSPTTAQSTLLTNKSKKTLRLTREGLLRKNIVAVSFFQDCAIHPYS